MTAAICLMPSSSSKSLCRLCVLVGGQHGDTWFCLVGVTHWTSSRIVVKGNSGPYRPLDASLSLAVTGLADPYGLPRLFMQTMKNLEVSKTRPGPPSNGPHQSLTSALPVRAWQMTMALSPFGLSFPRVVYATGTFRSVAPDSSLNSGIMAICWSGIRAANGFSGWDDRLSYRYSVAVLLGDMGIVSGQDKNLWSGLVGY